MNNELGWWLNRSLIPSSIQDIHYWGSWWSVTAFKTLCLLYSLRSDNNCFIPEHKLSDYLIQGTRKIRAGKCKRKDRRQYFTILSLDAKELYRYEYKFCRGRQVIFNDDSHSYYENRSSTWFIALNYNNRKKITTLVYKSSFIIARKNLSYLDFTKLRLSLIN